MKTIYIIALTSLFIFAGNIYANEACGGCGQPDCDAEWRNGGELYGSPYVAASGGCMEFELGGWLWKVCPPEFTITPVPSCGSNCWRICRVTYPQTCTTVCE